MTPHSPLKFVGPGWFAVVMGLSGLALAWLRAVPVLREEARWISIALAGGAAAIFIGLAVLSVLRGLHHAEALREDLQHPVRHPFVAAAPIALLLLATLWVAHAGPNRMAEALWMLASVAQFAATLFVLSRWWRGFKDGKAQVGGLGWPGVTPLLILPVVGNVITPLAGVALGHAEWSAAQFGIGLLFWPVVLVLILVRVASTGLWPDRLLPTGFILVAPPAVIGLSLLALGAPVLLAWSAWGMALIFLAWAALLAPRILKLPFALPHWSSSFPLAAFAGLTLALAPGLPAVGLLAFVSVLVFGLSLATWRGLRAGTLLAPEPVAAIHPVSA
jgi:tellurite resistance protein